LRGHVYAKYLTQSAITTAFISFAQHLRR
jgi:hypothetical protein